MTTPAKPTETKGNLIWIGVIVVVVVLGVLAIVIAKGGKDDGERSATKVRPKGECPAATTSTTGTDRSAPPLDPYAGPGNDTAICATIPSVAGKDLLTGKSLKIEPDGTAKIVLFMAHWCPHCQREVPLIVDHLKSRPMPDDVDLIGVSTSVRPDQGNYPPEAWLKRVGWKQPMLEDSADSTAGQVFGLSSFPYFVVVDADGKVVYRTSGEISMGDFDQLVDAARTGKPPA